MGCGPPLTRGRRGRVRGRLGSGHENSTNAPIISIPEVLSTGGAKGQTFAKEVSHPHVVSRDPSLDDRVDISPETPSYTTGYFFSVTVHTSPM